MFKAKTVKKTIGCLVALTMVMTNSFMGITVGGRAENVAYAEDELTYTVGNSTYTFTILGNGTVQINDYKGIDKEIVIPSKIEGKSVTSIGDWAFSSCRSLTNVEIPNSVTNIGYEAFENCSGLTSIDIPNSVTRIESFAFWGCNSLASIDIPSSVTNIGERVFERCDSLKKINVDKNNKNYKSLEGILFNKDMSKLIKYPEGKINESYIIPDGVTTIYDNAFFGCSRLKSIEIPNSVTIMGAAAFGKCSGLTNIEIPDSVRSIEYGVFYRCSGLTSIKIPDSVTVIEAFAFEECSSLASVEIPNSVTVIDGYVFYRCSSLTNIEIPDSITDIEHGVFSGCSSLLSVKIPNSITSIGDGAFEECSSLVSIDIPNTVTSIGKSVFEGCNSLQMINIEEENKEYKSIDGVLFNKDMTKLISYPSGKKNESSIIPDSVTDIDNSAFSGCRSLTSIDIPNSVKNIGNSAFSGCSNLASIEISDSVVYIGSGAFDGCNGLEIISVEEGNMNYTSKEGILFNEDMSKLIKYPEGKKNETYKIPNSVTNIGNRAFSGCSSFVSIEIPDSVTNIEDYVFEDCSSLSSIEIPDSVTVLGKKIFSGCRSLTSIKNSNSVTYIGEYEFEGCVNLKNIEISNNVTAICDGAFSGCSGLESIEILSGAIYIGSNSFEGCSGLESIEIPDSVIIIGEEAFSGCYNLTIYGENGSYAEQYANGYEIPFVSIKSFSDDITNIKVKYTNESISENISLKTKQLSETDEEFKNIIFTDKVADSTVKPEDVIFTAYDISLVDENNSIVQPNGTVTVKIPCTDGYNGENCRIYRLSTYGKFTDMNAKYQNGYMVFETDHFSTYIITETELVTKVDYITGDANGDGNMDIKDSAIIKRYLAGWDVEIDMTAADMDGDGKVTIKDSALIKRQLAGWE